MRSHEREGSQEPLKAPGQGSQRAHRVLQGSQGRADLKRVEGGSCYFFGWDTGAPRRHPEAPSSRQEAPSSSQETPRGHPGAPRASHFNRKCDKTNKFYRKNERERPFRVDGSDVTLTIPAACAQK